MVKIGTALRKNAAKVMLCGGGELGKEVAIALQGLGVEVIVVDRYADAPAMQVAHRSHVINMQDGDALRAVISHESPDMVVPEIEAIATDMLAELESEGLHIVPTARATQLTMNREGIRRLAAEKLGLPTSPYRFADSEEDCRAAMASIGLPCVVKPVMSSSGKGQSTAKTTGDIAEVWRYSQEGGRTGRSRVIVEGFVDFDYEITLLTVRHKGGTDFCTPIGHRQAGGDYQESWQPHPMSEKALAKAQTIAKLITDALTEMPDQYMSSDHFPSQFLGSSQGYGLFGVELFVKGDEVIFSEISPRPHDTGLVTLISQDLSEFDLHVRAILGLPIPSITQYGSSASAVILGEGQSDNISFSGLDAALSEPGTDIRLFGKPAINGTRRLGVVVARGDNLKDARAKAARAASAVKIHYN